MNFTLTLPEFTNPLAVTWWLFTHGGFIAVIITVLWGIFWMYMQYIQSRFLQRMKWVLLAVDVPRENEQTPKAVEHIFSQLHGLQKTPDWKETYLEGYVQMWISLELISIGGYIQYLIYCPVYHRDSVEASIYAQYPNAEISEVEDYVDRYKAEFPNSEYNMWGAELILINKEAYPIKTYPLWEHSLTQTFLDPMASLLEVMGRLQPAEQIWLQWVIRPTINDSWRKRGLKLINKLIGAKEKKSAGLLDSLSDAPGKIMAGTFETLTRTLAEPDQSSRKMQKDEPPSLMLHLPPNVRTVVEAVGMKISKIGFETKCRFLYFAPPDIFSKARVAGIFGALKQYSSLDMNGFKPDKKMKTAGRVWFFVKQRTANVQRRLLWGYKYRSIWKGRKLFMLNIEELASLWHFPVITVKAPLVKKTEAKRGEPPTELPIGEEIKYQPKTHQATAAEVSASPVPTGSAPTNLPFSP